MSLVRHVFCSSLGKKYLMALTGLVLLGFVTGHLVGNLQVFSPPDKINGYAHFLQGLGPVLWVVRLTLLAVVALHVWAMTQLSLENSQARPLEYDFRHTIQATLASRSMRWTGAVIAAFVVYHILHFTVGVDNRFFVGGAFKTRLPEYVMTQDFHLLGLPIVAAGAKVYDVHTMVVLGFQHWCVALFYIIATSLLSVHLWHGFESAFQSLGLRSSAWGYCLRCFTRAFVILYFLGNLAIPGAVLAGVVKVGGGCSTATAVAPCCTK